MAETSTVENPDLAERVIVDRVDIIIDIDEEIHRAMNGITDLEKLPMNAKELVSAHSTDENGNVTSVEVYTTTREIKMPETTLNDDESKIY